jgi:L-alanine-DL-glutamate epimerase-like enolase superfamily enzyme
MELRVHRVELPLAETFTIARHSADVSSLVQVELTHDGITGMGEGAPVGYRGETPESGARFLAEEAPALVGNDPFALEAIERRLAARPGERGAKAALDGALHDWLGKRTGLPVWRLLGLDRAGPPTSYTIGIDSVAGTADRARRARGFRFLKVKVGGPDDLARLEAVRAHSDAVIRVDGNEGWTFEQARELAPTLVKLGVEFVEQPFPVAETDAVRALRALEPRLPVIVDEGCADLGDVAEVAGYADGINIKLAKAGGLREALRMVHAARALGLAVMLGCMVESQLGIAQAAQIASLVDHVDLDGHLLLARSDHTGLELVDGVVLPAEAPGLGVARA